MYLIRSTISLTLFTLFLANSVYSKDINSVGQEPKTEFNQELLDSLKLTYSNLNDSIKIKKIISHSIEFGYFYPDEIIHLIDETIDELEKKNDKRAQIELYFHKNQIIADSKSDLDGSRKLSYYMLNNLPVNAEEQALIFDFIARTHLAKSELKKAQVIYQKALKRLQEMERPYSRAHINVYWGIAVTYSESRNYKKSSDYYHKCINNSEHLKQYFMVSACLLNLASNANKMGQPEISKKHLDKASKTLSKIKKKANRVSSELGLLNAYGDYYKNQNKLDSAEICLTKCIKLSEKHNDFFSKSFAMQSLGAVYLELNRLDEAEDLLLKSNKLFNEKAPSLLLENSFYLYQLYEKKGMFKESLKWHLDYATLRDSVQKVENVEIIAQATAKYEVELKDKTIDLLKKEKIVEEQSKEKYKNQWQIAIILFMLLLVLGAFYLNHNRHQKNKKKIINQVLGEERERTRISMDLHDGVCSQITTISRLVKNDDESNNAVWRKKVADKLDNLNLEVRDISHNLSLIKYDQRIPFQHILEDYIGDLQETVSIQFVIDFTPEDKHVFLESDRELILFRVIQEICNNAIKYSQTETMTLNFVTQGYNLSITISDHGIGFDASSSANGIRNIFERIEFLKGKVKLDSKNNGTTFKMQIPLKQNELNQK